MMNIFSVQMERILTFSLFLHERVLNLLRIFICLMQNGSNFNYIFVEGAVITTQAYMFRFTIIYLDVRRTLSLLFGTVIIIYILFY